MHDAADTSATHDAPAPPRLNPPPGSMLHRMLERGYEFDFFQAVWLLERLDGDCPAVGDRGPVARERLRFRPDVELGFPSTDLRRVRQVEDPEREKSFFLVDSTFLGLYGVSTPLPLHYAVDVLREVDRTAVLAGEERRGPPTDEPPPVAVELQSAPQRDFLDVIHHRIGSLFYRAWAKYRFERSYVVSQRSVVIDYLLWLIGLSDRGVKLAPGLGPIRLLRYAGVLTQHPKAALSLEGMLADFLAPFDVAVRQFDGRWVTLQPADLNSIGQRCSGLGTDLTVGAQVFDLSGAFQISVGQLTWAEFLEFLPDGDCYAQVCALTSLYCSDPLSFRVELRLKANEVPALQLGAGPAGARLGYTTWVRTKEVGETSVIFDGVAAPSLAA